MRKLNLAKRLTIPVVILAVALIAIAVISFTQLEAISKLSEKASLSDDRVENILMKNLDHVNWVMCLRDSIDNGVEYDGQSDPTKCGFGLWMYSDEAKNINNATVQKLLQEIEPYHNKLHESMHIINEYISAGKIEMAGSYYKNEVYGLLVEITDRLDGLKSEFVSESEGATATLSQKEKGTKAILIIVSSLSIFLGVTLSTLIIINVVRQLRKNANSLSKSALMVSSASSQLTDAGQQLAEGSNEQAASIEETSAVMDETSSMVKQNAENTRQANILSKEARAAAEDGSDKVKNMTLSMDELKKSSSEIAKIIKVIDDIAFQTNMLALNAAVEAARAGDAGQGFAVVAEEVRNLAQKSAEAAKNTAEIIDKNIDLSDQGVQISALVSTALDEIMSKTKDVNMLMDEITAASEEQAKGTAQITDAIGQMEKVVQQNAATAQESAASAEELKKQAYELESIVDQLNIMVKRSGKYNNITTNNPDVHTFENSNTNSMREAIIIHPSNVIPLEDNDGF